MQAVKEKLSDMSAMRKAKADAKAEEKEEKDLAKARVGIAHEVRLAREAEAAMELHVAKAGRKAEEEMAKHAPHLNHDPAVGGTTNDHHHHHGHHPDNYGAPEMGTNCAPTRTAGAPSTNNLL